MEIAFILIGIVLLVAAVRGTHTQLFNLLKNDFTGQNNFVIWLASLLAIGAIGYIKPIRPISTALLVLVIIVMILAQQKNGSGGFFTQLVSQLRSTQTPAPMTSQTPGGLDSLVNSVDKYLGKASSVADTASKLAGLV